MSRERRITVDGETFIIRRRGTGYDYDWVSGPNPGYGFSGGAHPVQRLDDDAHEDAIREFLAEADAKSGYLSED